MSKNKVIVIGSNSFSGASFCDYLLSRDYEVFAASRSEEPKSVFLPYTNNKNKLKFYQYDVNTHISEIVELIKKEKITKVVNYAAQSMVAQSWQHPEHWYMTNTYSTIKLHNELRQLDFLDKYVHISTPEVYGSCNGLVKEHTNYNPSTPYATSRAAADMSLKNFYDVYDFPVVFTRAANVYGQHQQIYRIIPKTIFASSLGEQLPLHGGGHSKRSFIHIDDVSDATEKIMNGGKNGDIYHISGKENITIRNLVEMILDGLDKNFDECVNITEDRLGKDSAYLLDSSKLRDELGWNDNISLKSGISQTVDWVKNNIDILKKQPLEYIHKA